MEIENSLFRTKRDSEVSYVDEWFLKPGEWDHDHDGKTKESEVAWIKRYEHERDILLPIIDDYSVNKIIELGSGPGKLSQMLIDKRPHIDFHLVDKLGAKNGFEHRGYKGTFHLRDLNLQFDTQNIPDNFDLLITNDFLEHIQSPSRILLDSRKIIKENGIVFVSVPNWRNGHDFIYRGLFDYDNFVYMMKTHGFELIGYMNSVLTCNSSPKLQSEGTMPDDLINSWNWYLLFRKV